MCRMFILFMALFGCVIVCGSYPGFREELQHVTNEDNVDPLFVKKDRDKRNANHPEPEELKPAGTIDKSVAQLANDQEFMNNLKNVFGEKPQPIAPANLAFVFDDGMLNLTNENNTGTDDRLQPFNVIMKKLEGFVPTTETPIAGMNDIHTETKKYKDDQMQQVFGSPPYHKHETEAPTPIINQTKTEPVENTTETDYRFTSATIIRESYNRMGRGDSSKNIIWFYMYFISLIVLLLS